MAKRNSKTTTAQLNMAMGENLGAVVDGAIIDENAVLNSLLAEVSGEPAAPVEAADEIVEGDDGTPAITESEIEAAVATAEQAPEVEASDAAPVVDPTTVPEEDLEAALIGIEIQEATQAAYAEAGEAADAAASEADKPKTDATAAADTSTTPKKEKVRHGPPLTKSQKVVAKLGERASEFLLLEIGDASLDEEALKLRQEEVLAEVDGLAKKVAEKATMLFGWLKSGGKLNEVMLRTFKVLIEDGEITSGVKGNLQSNLLAKPYSAGTAASQANQMFMLLPALKVTKKEKGRMVANPDSLILAKAKAELGL
ncbi:DUF3558 domain-containing protein [Ralstonia pickettii]|uniref:hypothetical protein n=1 Tax=Ralstonia pickettii TaxID=329 RepID=UPI002714734B|nr:hypothetical protein [Ralstonia pickettii]WKZ86298.1 DUF3558 domain-containing protein [Ralstonia pickettii]